MTYKLIALDLDGTLKSTDKQILPKTKAILQELAKRGVVIVLALGRPTAGLYIEANELELIKQVAIYYHLMEQKLLIIKQKKSYIKKCTTKKWHIMFMSEPKSTIWR